MEKDIHVDGHHDDVQQLDGSEMRRAIELNCDIPAQGLIGLIEYSYQQVATSFPEADFQRTPGLSVLDRSRLTRSNLGWVTDREILSGWSNLGWVTDREILPGCARVRTKCAEKVCTSENKVCRKD